jgi:hypothetical protein
MRDIEADQWIVDSGLIVDYLEDKFPDPRLGKSASIPATYSPSPSNLDAHVYMPCVYRVYVMFFVCCTLASVP